MCKKPDCARLPLASGIAECVEAFLDESFAVAFMKSADGRYEYVNRKWEQTFGRTLSEVRGKTDFDLWPAEIAEKLVENDKEILSSGRAAELIEEVPRADGIPLHWMVSKFVVREASGKQHLGGAAVDITDRIRAEEELRGQTKVLEAINKVLHDSFARDSEDELGKTCLSIAERLTGSKFGFVGEVNGSGSFDTIALSDPGWEACRMPASEAPKLLRNMKIQGLWGKVLKTGLPRIVNDPSSEPDSVGTPEGHPVITSFLGVPLKESGRTIGMIGLANKERGYSFADQRAVEDLSGVIVETLKRKRAEDAVAAKERFHRSLIEGSSDVILILTAEGTVSYASPYIERAIGYKPEQITGKAFAFVHPDDIPAATEALHALIEEGEGPVRKLELRIRYADGSWHYIEAKGRNLLGDPIVRGIVMNLRDITERKQTEEKLARYSQHLEEIVEERTKELAESKRLATIGETALMVGHDLRNPLQVMTNSIFLIDTRFSNTQLDCDRCPECRKLVSKETAIVKEQMTYVDKVLSDLIDYSSTRGLELATADLPGIVDEALSVVSIPSIIKVSVDIEEGIPPLVVDRTAIRRVLSNLITNAVQAMPRGGQLTIRISSAEGAASIDVEDTGEGIPKENMDKMFEPLFTTRAKGQGLGLAVCRKLVEAHGGSIAIESKVGKGTRVKVTIPLDPKDESKAA
jgi:PAS domain S-box-containing protein